MCIFAELSETSIGPTDALNLSGFFTPTAHLFQINAFVRGTMAYCLIEISNSFARNRFLYKNMRNRSGVTEAYWASMNEDKRFMWKLFTRCLAVVFAWFVSKTGVKTIDWFVSGFTALLPMLVIESQRSYRKFSPKIRKILAKTIIFIGSWGTAILGIAYLAEMGVAAIANTLVSSGFSHTKRPISDFQAIVITCTFFLACLMAIIRVMRNLQIEELVFHLPRKALAALLVRRDFIASDFQKFSYFEVMTLFSGFCYASVVAEIAKPIFLLF